MVLRKKLRELPIMFLNLKHNKLISSDIYNKTMKRVDINLLYYEQDKHRQQINKMIFI